jgi:hypothetical protein
LSHTCSTRGCRGGCARVGDAGQLVQASLEVGADGTFLEDLIEEAAQED